MVLPLSKGPEHPKKLVFFWFFLNLKKTQKNAADKSKRGRVTGNITSSLKGLIYCNDDIWKLNGNNGPWRRRYVTTVKSN